MDPECQTCVHPDILLLDAHVHMRVTGLCEAIRESMDAGGCGRMNLVSTIRKDGGNENEILLHYKEKDPERFYLFGALDYRGPRGEAFDPLALAEADRKALAERLGKQAGQLKSQGFDGVKLIEGKPTSRRILPFPLDSEVYALFFAAAERERIPLVWHVGDPESYWDPQKIPPHAIQRGWLYERPRDPDLASLRREAENVLRRHPNLAVIFAHFYFLGDQLARARELLQTFPNLHLDTTPGGQMYAYFNAQREEARRFFVRFQDRIIFGTDLGPTRDTLRWPSDRAIRMYRSMREYFGSEDAMAPDFPGSSMLAPGETMRGLDLPNESLGKLFHGNFERLAGEAPAGMA